MENLTSDSIFHDHSYMNICQRVRPQVEPLFVDLEASNQTIVISDDDDEPIIILEVPARPNIVEELFLEDTVDSSDQMVLRDIERKNYEESTDDYEDSEWMPSDSEPSSESDEETLYTEDLSDSDSVSDSVSDESNSTNVMESDELEEFFYLD